MPEPALWWSAHAYGLFCPTRYKWWGHRGWVEKPGQAKFYDTWDLAERAKDRHPDLIDTIACVVVLTVADDSRKHVKHSAELRAKPPGRSLF